MQPQFQTGASGAEVRRQDYEGVARQAAKAEDFILAELLKLPPVADGQPRKGVIPYVSGVAALDRQLVLGSGSANSSVVILPFRAYIGPTAIAAGSSAPKTALEEARTAIYCTADAVGFGKDLLQLDPTVSNHRWDLIYARIDRDVATPFVPRFVRANGVQEERMVRVQTLTTAMVAVVKGTEGATPSKPSLPADGAGAWYIPLAYVYLAHPHGGATQINHSRIDEVAPILSIASAFGGTVVAPCDQNYAEGGTIKTNEGQAAGARPDAYLPSSMVGEHVRRTVLDLYDAGAGSPSIGLNTSAVVDSSIDWRRRFVEAKICLGNAPTAGARLPWSFTGSPQSTVPSGLVAPIERVAQTFVADGALASPTISNAAIVAQLTNAVHSGIPAGASVTFYVDMTTGSLCCAVSALDPQVVLYASFRASGRYYSALNTDL